MAEMVLPTTEEVLRDLKVLRKISKKARKAFEAYEKKYEKFVGTELDSSLMSDERIVKQLDKIADNLEIYR